MVRELPVIQSPCLFLRKPPFPGAGHPCGAQERAQELIEDPSVPLYVQELAGEILRRGPSIMSNARTCLYPYNLNEQTQCTGRRWLEGK